jgi:hypothetical protein
VAEYLPTNDGRPLKTQDAMLDKISELIVEREAARIELAVEKVAHRVTKKELREVTGMVLK